MVDEFQPVISIFQWSSWRIPALKLTAKGPENRPKPKRKPIIFQSHPFFEVLLVSGYRVLTKKTTLKELGLFSNLRQRWFSFYWWLNQPTWNKMRTSNWVHLPPRFWVNIKKIFELPPPSNSWNQGIVGCTPIPTKKPFFTSTVGSVLWLGKGGVWWKAPLHDSHRIHGGVESPVMFY